MAARAFNFNQSASGHGLNDIFPEKNMIQTCVHCSFPRFEDKAPNISQLWLEVVLLSIYEPLVLKWTSQTQTTADHFTMLPTDRKNGINSRSSHGAAWSLRRADRFEKFHESCALAPRNKPGTSRDVIRTRSSEECVSKVKLTIGDGYNIKLCVYIYIYIIIWY